MDIVVEWESQLSEAAIGETHVAAGVQGDEAVFEIVRFVLATRIPESFYAEEEPAADAPAVDGTDVERGDSAAAAGEPEQPVRSPDDPPDALTLAVVQLTAAHELGHALGLPHSDSPNDVMYPETSGASLSRRDIQTVRAFYSLPVGTRPRP